MVETARENKKEGKRKREKERRREKVIASSMTLNHNIGILFPFFFPPKIRGKKKRRMN